MYPQEIVKEFEKSVCKGWVKDAKQQNHTHDWLRWAMQDILTQALMEMHMKVEAKTMRPKIIGKPDFNDGIGLGRAQAFSECAQILRKMIAET